MSRPQAVQSVTDAGAATTGTHTETGGRNTLGLWVLAENLDPETDEITVVLEGSFDGDHWTSLRMPFPDDNIPVEVDQDDFEDPDNTGTHAAINVGRGVTADLCRARVVDHPGGDVSVDAWVTMTSNPQGAQDYRMR